MGARSGEEIAKLIKNTKFRHRLFGGIREEDAWKLMDKARREYEAQADAQRQWYEALIAERDARLSLSGGNVPPVWHPPQNAPPEQRAEQSEKRRKAETAQTDEIINQKLDRIDQKRAIRGFFIKLMVIAGCGYLLFTQVFGVTVMHGEAMYPRIRDGDLMLYYRLEKQYAIGDVVTFAREGVRYTGRIVAKGGDKVFVDEIGQLSINDWVQSEEIFYPTYPDANGVAYPVTVEAESLFLLCDMRTNATDSRVYGTVALDEVDGKVMTVLRRRGI